MTRVLIVGVPRSGTSWVGRVLGSTPGAAYIGEPDNHEHAPFGLRAKLGLPGYFYPRPAGDADDYERLWRAAFAATGTSAGARLGPAGRARRKVSAWLLHSATDAELLAALRRPSEAPLALRLAAALAVPERPGHPAKSLVVKSVHAQLALDWIVARFPVRVILVLRNPLNVLSSWQQLGWLEHEASDPLDELDPRVARELAEELGVRPLGAGASRLARSAWLIGLLTSGLLFSAERHPDWDRTSHEALCERPHERFAALAKRLDLEWSVDVDALLDDLDRPGTGYETTRQAVELTDIWRRRLTPEQAHEAQDVLSRFPVDDWTHGTLR